MNLQVKELISRIWTQEEKGQTLGEYGLIISLIALVAIMGLTLFGNRLLGLYQVIVNAF